MSPLEKADGLVKVNESGWLFELSYYFNNEINASSKFCNYGRIYKRGVEHCIGKGKATEFMNIYKYWFIELTEIVESEPFWIKKYLSEDSICNFQTEF